MRNPYTLPFLGQVAKTATLFGILIGWWAEILDWGKFWPTFRAAAMITVAVIAVICIAMIVVFRPNRRTP